MCKSGGSLHHRERNACLHHPTRSGVPEVVNPGAWVGLGLGDGGPAEPVGDEGADAFDPDDDPFEPDDDFGELED